MGFVSVILKSLVEALDLGIHIIFPLHCPSLLNLPLIQLLLYVSSCVSWGELKTPLMRQRAMFSLVLFKYLLKGWNLSLIVNSGSPPPQFLFLKPLQETAGPNTHSHICRRPLHQSGCCQGCPAVIHNYPLRPSPGPLWEAMEKSCYIIIWLDCCRRQCQETHLCAPGVAPNNQQLWLCGFKRKGPQDKNSAVW